MFSVLATRWQRWVINQCRYWGGWETRLVIKLSLGELAAKKCSCAHTSDGHPCPSHQIFSDVKVMISGSAELMGNVADSQSVLNPAWMMDGWKFTVESVRPAVSPVST